MITSSRIAPSLEELRAVARPGLRVPFVLERPLNGFDPLDLYGVLSRHGRTLLLESGDCIGYSYVMPAAGEAVRWSVGDEEEPFDWMRSLLAGDALPVAWCRGFSGGYVGAFSYDLARAIERLPVLAEDDLPIPAVELYRVEQFYAIDHETDVFRAVVSVVLDERSLEEQHAEALAHLEAMVAQVENLPARSIDQSRSVEKVSDPMEGVETSLDKASFEKQVRRALEYIRAGDIFQVNLSLRLSRRFAGDSERLYDRLRRINPSPWMALLPFDERTVVSASPELLLRVGDGRIETRPIAGTRKRGASSEEDERMREELRSDPKERAEHLMMVDLERNDIGRVARYGTVRVPEFMTLESYSHVTHIVSHVEGELADGRDAIDALRALFPGGTITGAPKVRSMEIIEELEPTRRGLYTGSIGWLGFDGSAELNIAIRTITLARGRAWVQVGAGIVADSIPEREYRESLRKAGASLEALVGEL